MRASWTRDEVILGLDVLFSQNCQRMYKANPAVIELSQLLNRLPIIPQRDRYTSFRNPVGVSSMLRKFYSSFNRPNQKFMVGEMFFIVYNEYKDNLGELHRIAQAIRRCESIVSSMQFGDVSKNDGFPEGAILSHIHRNTETHYTEKCKDKLSECEVCGLRPEGIYINMVGRTILGKHLLVPPYDLDPEVKYNAADFITVCPNCHRALHIIRPWRGQKDCESILI